MSNFEFTFGSPSQSDAAQSTTNRLRILVLADYRGDNDTRPPLDQRQPRRVNIDNFADRMKRWSPRMSITIEDDSFVMGCTKLEDFEPDALFTTLPPFDALRQSRADIADGKLPDSATSTQEPALTDSTDNTKEDVGDTLSRLLGDDTSTGPKKKSGGLLDSFIANVVADEITPSGSDKAGHLAACDAAIAEIMRRVLHHPKVQRSEASWRGLYALINALEDEELVSVYAMDVNATELQADLLDGDRQNSTLVTRLVEEGKGTFGGEAWDIIVADLMTSPDQAELVAALGAVAKAAGGRLLTDADVTTLDDETPASWQALRSSTAARTVCLTTPRVLLRAPWGRQSEEPDTFGFEECVAEPATEELLWGSGALLVATCLAQQFESGNRSGNLSDQPAAQDRPMFVFEKDGSRHLQPVAEKLLSDNQAEALRAKWGVMPLRPERNGNRLLFPALQHLAAH
ncbi:MAG: hypothetical protein HKN70_07425 [Gammaproteobacteria bacterium]|nr:hypothetical protein [Gammaproteobacteria bacterium]